MYRRMTRISWTEHATNEDALKELRQKKKQLGFLGHVMRKEGLENLMKAKIEGKPSRGRQSKASKDN